MRSLFSSWARLPFSDSPEGLAWKTGFGFTQVSNGNLCSWLFLAPPQRLFSGNDAEHKD